MLQSSLIIDIKWVLHVNLKYKLDNSWWSFWFFKIRNMHMHRNICTDINKVGFLSWSGKNMSVQQHWKNLHKGSAINTNYAKKNQMTRMNERMGFSLFYIFSLALVTFDLFFSTFLIYLIWNDILMRKCLFILLFFCIDPLRANFTFSAHLI